MSSGSVGVADPHVDSVRPSPAVVAKRSLFKTAGLGGVLSVVRLAVSYFTIKTTAVYLGPSGLALVAQLQNFVGLANGMVGNSIGTAISRLYAELRPDPSRGHRLLATAWRLGLFASVILMVVIALDARGLAGWLLTSEEHAPAMIAASIAVFCTILNAVVIGAMIASGEVGRVVLSSAIATVAGFAIYVPTAIIWGVSGGLIGSAISSAVCLPITLIVLRSLSTLKLKDFRGVFHREDARRILTIAPLVALHSVTTPLALILIRDMIVSRLGLETAGIWQASWRLSEVYRDVVMTSVSLYFMARLGEVVGTPLFRREVIKTSTLTVALTAVFSLGVWLLRDVIVQFVFTAEFLEARDLLPFQLLGDVMKMGAWTLEVALVALIRSRWYIGLQVVIPAVYLAGATLLVPAVGVQGVSWAYCASAALHLVIAFVALRDVLRPPDRA